MYKIERERECLSPHIYKKRIKGIKQKRLVLLSENDERARDGRNRIARFGNRLRIQ